MAKERQREMSESEERKARINQRIQDLDAEYEKVEKERKLEESQKAFGKRKEILANKAADMIAKHGKDYFMSQTMLTFLDVAIQMEDAISMLNDVNTAMSCITDAISCMDNILEVNALALDTTLEKKHGFFARRKAKKRIRQTIRNNNGRMKEISDVLSGNQMIAISIVNALKKSNKSMQEMMEKNAAKQKKLEARTPQSAHGGPSSAEKLVDGILGERGQSVAPSVTDSPAPDVPPAPTQGAAGDISDIL